MKKLNTIFKNKFITTKTPLRISFSGGGTDMPYFYEKYTGVTVSTTINKFVYVTIKTHNNYREKFRLNYSDTEIVQKVKNIKNLRIRETLNYFKINEPLYISTISDLPYNTGLGSSSAFLVGLVNAIFLLKNEKVNLKKITEIAFKIENKITNNSLGKQDHYIASYGGLKKITYKKNTINVKKINIVQKNKKYLNNNLLFFWTGRTRLSNKNLNDQKKNFKDNIIGLKNIKNVAINLEKELVNKKINLKKIGSLLDQNWKMKRKFTNSISNNYLNKIYKDAISAGSYGGKLLGAGGGGFFLFVCKKKFQKKLISKLKNCNIVEFKFEDFGTSNCFID